MFGFGKAKNETWTGVVVRKGQGKNYDEDGEATTYYTLDVKRDDTGKTKHYVVGRGHVSTELYNSVSEGNKVVKPSGTRTLQKA
ncbi:MAG TPA: hypothetical protein VF261_00185 [Candidatus Saccharimonadales bacterium]